jgi:hypothetical protein
MPSDMLWAPRFRGSKHVLRTKGNEEYMFEIFELEEFLVYSHDSKSIWKWKIQSDNRNGCKKGT